MGMSVGQVVRWWCREAMSSVTLLLSLAVWDLLVFATPGLSYQDAVHITAILGESVVFNCHVEFPEEHPVPYVLQWEKKGLEIPIFIWYDSYPTHSGEGYEGRVSRVSPDSPYGLASLNLTNIRESDQGWYECKVVFLNRSPHPHKNGTWFHLDVHAPPRFSVTPEEIIYVNLGDAIILNCQAEGTPTPEILWYKDANPVEPSATIGIFNDGTELRISNIRHEDIGDYTCIARNGEGQISHTARVIIAGGAVIMVPPTNQTKLEGEKAQFSCEAKAQPGNVTVKWFREGVPVKEVSALETRVTIRRDGTLTINPVSADDTSQYLCEVSNGIGEPQTAAAYLNVEYPAKVTFTPTIQYLPFRLAGVVQCYIQANPPLQYVTWTKDKRLLEPYQTKDIVIMNNGSLLFTRVNQNHQGKYTCTPYNAQGTTGSSGPMEVLVRKPPVFIIEPDTIYQRKIGDSLEMPCEAQEAEGTQKPIIQWQRRDGTPLQRNRVKMTGGNITIENLRRTDFGYYQCVASNEVATIVTATQLFVEGTKPHAPYNISANASMFAVTLSWLPGYSGGPDYRQDYAIWYRESGMTDWSTIPVTPSGSTQVTINRLSPGTSYEFQVVGKNALGDGMFSNIIQATTKAGPTEIRPAGTPREPAPTEGDIDNYSLVVFPTDSTGSTIFPTILRPRGPKPGPPRNLTVIELDNGFLMSWLAPLERAHLVQYYVIKYKTDAQWKTLNKAQLRPEDTQYLVKNLVGGKTYYFKVYAHSARNYESTEEVKYSVPARVKHKAITAGVVGGILFFIVAIILSICAVKICNKRRRRRQERAYNMVACRITDARNGGQPPGASQVPLKNLKEPSNGTWSNAQSAPGLRSGRVSAVTLGALKRTQATVGQLTKALVICQPIKRKEGDRQHLGEREGPRYASYTSEYPLGWISRAEDGRFVLDSTSSSDEGGFLPRPRPVSGAALRHRGAPLRHPQYTIAVSGGGDWQGSNWRRPLVGAPSQVSLRTDGSGESALIGEPVQTIYAPRFRASSPGPLAPSQWTPANFSDLSSVRQLSSIERSFPSSLPITPSYVQDPTSSLKSVHEKYSQELPSLRAIHEEAARWQHVRAEVHRDPHTIPTPLSHRPLQPVERLGLLESGRHIHTPAVPYYHPHYPSPMLLAPAPATAMQPLHIIPDIHPPPVRFTRLTHQDQRPLATSSPPRPRVVFHAMTPQPPVTPVIVPHPSTPIQPWDLHAPKPYTTLPPPSTKPVLPAGIPRTRVRTRIPHQPRSVDGGSLRHARSAPELGTTDSLQASVTSGSSRASKSREQELLEVSPESRSSSSGFGSKNTSQQQSSQSGQSQASPLDASTSAEWRPHPVEALPPYRHPPPAPVHHHPPPLTAWSPALLRGTVPPAWMSGRHIQPQFRPPAFTQLHPAGYFMPHHTRAAIPRRYESPLSLERDVSLESPQHSVSVPSEPSPRTPTAHLDASVDGHYEFDAVFGVSPTPASSAPLSPSSMFTASPRGRTLSRQRFGSAEKGISDSEIYSSLYPKPKRTSKYDNIEARVQAMKEEFHEYRKRQIARRTKARELESAC